EAFETAWRRSQGDPRQLLQALAVLAAALLKWSQGQLEPAATLLGRARRRLEGVPSRLSGMDGEVLESALLDLEERLALREPVPPRVDLSLEVPTRQAADRLGLAARCPYCGERVTVHVEPTGVSTETYVEDCPVCCRPWAVHVERSPAGPSVGLAREDD